MQTSILSLIHKSFNQVNMFQKKKKKNHSLPIDKPNQRNPNQIHNLHLRQELLGDLSDIDSLA